MKKIVLVFAVWVTCWAANAQPGTDTIARKEDDIISLEDLMKAKVTVASANERTLRETPGVVTIITAKEIRNMGARDLIDVLRMVPGLDFAHDLDGVISMGVRGNWAQEAKVMVMVDGVDMTEIAYGSQQFMAHYTLDIVERIEIIRGPGSAIYGGNASLAVINIITKDAEKINGIGIYANYGQMQNTYGRINGTVNAGRKFANGLAVAGSVSYGVANKSDRMAYLNGQQANYADSSHISSMFVNLGIKYKGLSARYIFDNYTTQITGQNNTYLFGTHAGSLSYDWKITDKVTLTPRVSFKNQLPWFYKNKQDTAAYNTNVNTQRFLGSTVLKYKPIDELEILVGAEYFHDNGKVYLSKSDFLFGNNTRKVNYYNVAAYLQAQWYSKWINITGGLRVDKHNLFGYVAVPRVVLTKVLGRFHGKLMYSKAFRAPMIFNMDVNPQINPEKTTVMEAEIGCRLSNSIFATVNLFNNQINSPIIYSYVNDTESYVNGNRIGSRGAEFEIRLNQAWGYITANYSYYYGIKRDANDYAVPGQKGVNLALAAHKATLNGNVKLYKTLFLNVGSVFYSDRYAYNSNGDLIHYKPTLLLSSFLQFDNVVKGLNIGAGVYDILGQNYQFGQAYRSYSDAVPGPGREFILRLRYKISFN